MLKSSLENISTNRVRYINTTERYEMSLKYDSVLPRAMWKIYIIAGPKSNPGMARIYYSAGSFGDLEFLSRAFMLKRSTSEISLLSCERDRNVENKPISKGSRARIKRDVWRLPIDTRSFYVNSACWKHDNDTHFVTARGERRGGYR